jgi:hypothetical protein
MHSEVVSLKEEEINEIDLDDEEHNLDSKKDEEEPDNQSEGELSDNSEQDGSTKPKQKRRSKNDAQGRDHKCTFCEKTYLSYPALYTHMKNKHAKGPDGQPFINFNSGRGRGRPKKNSNLYPMPGHF